MRFPTTSQVPTTSQARVSRFFQDIASCRQVLTSWDFRPKFPSIFFHFQCILVVFFWERCVFCTFPDRQFLSQVVMLHYFSTRDYIFRMLPGSFQLVSCWYPYSVTNCCSVSGWKKRFLTNCDVAFLGSLMMSAMLVDQYFQPYTLPLPCLSIIHGGKSL